MSARRSLVSDERYARWHLSPRELHKGKLKNLRFFGPKDIKIHLERILTRMGEDLKGKIVIDVPAGSGHSSRILRDLGARVEALDFYPEFFRVEGLVCKQADLSQTLPVPDSSAEMVLCQEGIEHLPNQLHALQECNRILKKGGILLVTTPNESKLRSKVSHMLSESEFSYKIMPPNELDSVWFSDGSAGKGLYFGHIFPIGVQRLRMLARLAGFRIQKIHHLRANHTSLLLLLILYPLILCVNALAYRKAMRLHSDVPRRRRSDVYGEILRLGIDPRILIDGHLCIEFAKDLDWKEVPSMVQGKYSSFDVET
jgi:SAM-dependent methyltransferase